MTFFQNKAACFFAVSKKRRNFAVIMTIELNEVTLPGEQYTLSMLAEEGLLTCISGGTPQRRTRWLYALMGFEMPSTGYVSVDGEPLTGGCIDYLRKNIAFVPAALDTVGHIVAYEPPTTADVLALRSNRRMNITPQLVDDEKRLTEATGTKAELLALAVLRRKPVLVVDSPQATSASYLKRLATEKGLTVIVATAEEAVRDCADTVVELI